MIESDTPYHESRRQFFTAAAIAQMPHLETGDLSTISERQPVLLLPEQEGDFFRELWGGVRHSWIKFARRTNFSGVSSTGTLSELTQSASTQEFNIGVRDAINRGVSVCIFLVTDDPRHTETDKKQSEDLITYFKKVNVPWSEPYVYALPYPYLSQHIQMPDTDFALVDDIYQIVTYYEPDGAIRYRVVSKGDATTSAAIATPLMRKVRAGQLESFRLKPEPLPSNFFWPNATREETERWFQQAQSSYDSPLL